VTPESSALRESIRQGLIAAHVDRAEFDWAVARVYELEREEDKQREWEQCQEDKLRTEMLDAMLQDPDWMTQP
jgi:hypothetical protein